MKTGLNNPALKALTTNEEQAEIKVTTLKCNPFTAPNHNPNCQFNHLVLRYALLQPGWGSVPPTMMWHVLSDNRAGQTTLSMEGLKDWGLL